MRVHTCRTTSMIMFPQGKKTHRLRCADFGVRCNIYSTLHRRMRHYHPYMDFCSHTRASDEWNRLYASLPVPLQGRKLGQLYRKRAAAYRSMSKHAGVLHADEQARRHPTLYEKLKDIRQRESYPEFTADEVRKILHKIDRRHLNQSEQDTLDSELPKLQIEAVRVTAFERLIGEQAPRHTREAQIFAYTSEKTKKLEDLTIRLTIDKLRGSDLGKMLFPKDEKQKWKPKLIIKALTEFSKSHPSFNATNIIALLSDTNTNNLSKPLSGRELDDNLFSILIYQQASALSMEEAAPSRQTTALEQKAMDANNKAARSGYLVQSELSTNYKRRKKYFDNN